ncbi:MAG: hypothetical protein Fur0018_19740 [Anaerolineales bacterium]
MYTAEHAALAAQAIANARLYERVIRDTDELERRVQQRTAEQRKLLNLMARRENRIAGLKKAVQILRQQLFDARLTPLADDPLLGEGFDE